MSEGNVSEEKTKFNDINKALEYCKISVTSYCEEHEQSQLDTAFKDKNEAIKACDTASELYVKDDEGEIVKDDQGNYVKNKTTENEFTKICTIKDIYVLAYFIMSQYFTNPKQKAIIEDSKKLFLDIQYDEKNIKSKIEEIKSKIGGFTGFGQAHLIAAAVAPVAPVTLSPPAAAPTLSPPAAAPTLSPPAAAPVTPALSPYVGPAFAKAQADAADAAHAADAEAKTKAKTKAKAKDLLWMLCHKLILLSNNTLGDLLEINQADYDNYYNNYMGFPDTRAFMNYIQDVNIFEKVKQFIEKITYKGKTGSIYVFTLHDIVGYATPVSKLNSQSYELSDYCKARDVFIKILQFIKKQYETQNINVDFVYPPLSGLKKSSTTCNPVYGALGPLSSVRSGQTWSQVINIAGRGGSKSRRIRRRKHNRKTHHKRVSKTYKRRRHSRSVRKHKKHTSRR
jgi:hypothetical protein